MGVTPIWLTTLACCWALSYGQTEKSRFYQDFPLIFKPNRDTDLLGTVIGTVQNGIKLTQNFVNELIFAIKNVKLPKNPFFVNPPQTKFNSSQLISKFLGYPLEEHFVHTSDGYILGLQRIPAESGSPIVLMLHGIFENSRIYVINAHAKQNLPTILSNEGYDVWLLNYRGAPNSLQHERLSQQQAEFWDFSINEDALIDLPETIHYILDKTGAKSLSLVGHSLGTTTSFALLSKNLDYNTKVKVLVAMAPTAKVTHVSNVLTDAYQAANAFTVLSAVLGTMGKILPGLSIINEVTSDICKISAVNAVVCQTTLSILLSFGSKNVNASLIPVVLEEFPTFLSSYLLAHYAQMIRDDRFQGYDFGEHNIEVYGTTYPTPFDVSKITVPVALLSSAIDNLANQMDIDYLRNNIKTIIKDLVVPKEAEYSHYDFVLGQNAYEMIYPTVLDILKMYNAI